MSQMNVGRALGLGTAVVASLVLSACANTKAGRPVRRATPPPRRSRCGQEDGKCSLEQYSGAQMNQADATVGFSRSKEADPFGIAEAHSMEDEAKKRGIQLALTDANSQLSRQIADNNTLLAKGFDALIVAPLSSDGLEPALNEAPSRAYR